MCRPMVSLYIIITKIDKLSCNTDDILRARLKTLGVSEHRFTLKAGKLSTNPEASS